MDTATRIAAQLAWWIKRGSTAAFDTLHRVDTGIGASESSVEIASPNRNKAVPYDPAPWPTLRRCLRLASLQAHGFTFVDIGCGKGRVLLSALTLPFARIVGVEFSPLLCRIAEQNIADALFLPRRCRAAQILCIDAVEYSIPDEPGIFFFYNPFSYEVMELVLDNILRAQQSGAHTRYLIFYGASSSMPKIEQYLRENGRDCARRLVSGRLLQRTVNIFEMSNGNRPAPQSQRVTEAQCDALAAECGDADLI